MSNHSRPNGTFNRRHALGFAAGTLGFSEAMRFTETRADQTQDLSYYVPRIMRSPFSDRNVDALVEALALLGIAVYNNPGDSAPVVLPSVPISPLQLLSFQVRHMAQELATGSGTPGHVLDAVFPEVGGVPPVSFLLAGYIAAAQTEASAFARMLMGEQAWEEAPTRYFPAVIIDLFVSDLAVEGASISFSEQMTIGRVNQPGGLCSAVQTFTSGVLEAVFGLLKIDQPNTGSNILVDVWNWIIGAGQDVVETVGGVLIAPVVAAIQAIAGALVIGTSISSMLQVWTVSLEADPAETRFGVDNEFVTGKVVAGVDAGAAEDWPEVLADCADSMGLALPSLRGEGSAVTWKVTETPIDLVLEMGKSPLVEDDGVAEYIYQTNNEPADVAAGAPIEGLCIVEIAVDRSDIAELRDNLLALLVANVPSPFDVAVEAVLGPAIAVLTAELAQTMVKGYSFESFPVIYHEDEITVTPDTGETGETAAACPIGEWMLLDLESYLATVMQAAALQVTVLGRGGTMLWTVNADGTYVFTSDEFGMTFTDGTYTFQLRIEGEESGNYVIEGDRLIGQVTSGFMQMEVAVQNLGGTEIPFPGIGQVGGLRFTCEGGDLLTWPPLDIPTDPVRWTSVSG